MIAERPSLLLISHMLETSNKIYLTLAFKVTQVFKMGLDRPSVIISRNLSRTFLDAISLRVDLRHTLSYSFWVLQI